MSLIDTIKAMFSDPSPSDYGPVVTYGKKQYYMAHLQNVNILTGKKSGAVLFVDVNPNNENDNKSAATIPANTMIGKVLTVVGENIHPYLVVESSYGKLFVDPADLDSTVLDNLGVPDVKKIAAMQADQDKKNPFGDMKSIIWGIVVVIVLITFFPLLRKYAK